MARLGPFGRSLAFGAAWGLTLPLIRIAVSTGHQPLGLIALAAGDHAGAARCRCSAPSACRCRRSRRHLPLFLVVAAFGSVLPGYFTFLTAARPARGRPLDHHRAGADVRAADGAGRSASSGRTAGAARRPARRGLMALICHARRPGDRRVEHRRDPARDDLAAQLRHRGQLSRLARLGGLHPFQLLFGASADRARPRAAAGGRDRADDLAARPRPGGMGAPRRRRPQRARLLGIRLAGRDTPARSSPARSPISSPASACSGRCRSSASATRRWVWAAFALMLAAIALVQPRSPRQQRA